MPELFEAYQQIWQDANSANSSLVWTLPPDSAQLARACMLFFLPDSVVQTRMATLPFSLESQSLTQVVHRLSTWLAFPSSSHKQAAPTWSDER